MGSLCKELHVLPRSGGVLDQPAHEARYLEKILDAYVRHGELQQRKERARRKNREANKVSA